MALAEALINARVLLLVCFLNFSGDPIDAVKSSLLDLKANTSKRECVEGYHLCPVTSKCVNRAGGYKCICNQGYEKVSQFQCIDINECKRGIHGCDPHSTCVNSPGSWQCRCNNGWYPDPTKARLPTCKDINECSRNPCPSRSRCTNTLGSYKCYCNRGFEPRPPKHASRCKDINECARGKYNCQKNSHCVNTQGSYRCHCNRCFHSNGPGKCEADCRSETRVTVTDTKVSYTSYYHTKCGFLGVKRCKKSRKRYKLKKKRVYRMVHIAVRKGARCPCS